MDRLQMVEESIRYIENNLHRTISLDELAAQAYCSKYYFHRTFRVATGETVMAYIRRRRLKKASLLLLKTGRGIRSIAYECGFTFHESFTRVFRQTYGLTPEEYRNNKRILLTCEKLDLDLNRLIEKPNSLSSPCIMDEADYQFVGLKCLTDRNPFSERSVAKVWNDFNVRIPEVQHRIDLNASFGVGFYNASPHLGYIACVRVDSTERLPKGMECKRIPPSRYARFTQTGADANVTASLDYIFGTWLADQNYTLSGEIDFIIRMDERYTRSQYSTFDIFIPILQ